MAETDVDRPGYPYWVPDYGNPEVVRALIAQGAAIDREHNRDPSMLMWVAQVGNPECVSLLLDAGADIEACYETGATSLMWAASQGHVETVKMLIEARRGGQSEGLLRRDRALDGQGPPRRCRRFEGGRGAGGGVGDLTAQSTRRLDAPAINALLELTFASADCILSLATDD